jgi:hypothetical protein
MEWVSLPATLFLNWHIAARGRPLISGAFLYYISRIWTYGLLYFRNLPAHKTAARKLAFCRFGELDCALGKP